MGRECLPKHAKTNIQDVQERRTAGLRERGEDRTSEQRKGRDRRDGVLFGDCTYAMFSARQRHLSKINGLKSILMFPGSEMFL